MTLFVPSVFAAGSVVIMPEDSASGMYSYTLDPGASVSGVAVVTNATGYDTGVSVLAVDATMSDSGSFALKDNSEEQTLLGSWVKLEKNILSMKANTSIPVKFTVNIPSSVSPGDYAGGLVVTAISSSNSGSTMASVVRIGVRMYISVSGEKLFKFTMGPDGTDAYSHSIEEDGSHNFNYSYKNEGNMNMTVNSTLELKNLFFKLDSVNTEMGILLPGSTGTPKINWGQAPKIGYITATSTLNYKPSSAVGKISDEEMTKYSGSETETLSFFILPVKELSAGLTIFVISFIFFFWRHRKLMALIASCKESVAKKDESLITYASRNKIDWKLLAKINRIASPYIITKGAKILIPHTRPISKE